MAKLELIQADTCLPDYWGGHHRAHIAVPVDADTTMPQLRQMLRDELMHGAVMGSDDNARLLSADWVPHEDNKRANAVTRAAHAAINRLRANGRKRQFRDLPESDDSGNSVYAFFVFNEVDP